MKAAWFFKNTRNVIHPNLELFMLPVFSAVQAIKLYDRSHLQSRISHWNIIMFYGLI